MAEHQSGPKPLSALGALPRSIWALGLVSLFMDISSELIHSLLPMFMVTVLGTGALSVGFVEGVAEATASITKVFSGAFSDWFGRRKPVVVMGYGLAALSKLLFPLAGSLGLILAARFADRVGKGIRDAPRDALVGDLTPAPLRGAAFGLRQALDTVGGVLGPLSAVGLMAWLAGDIRAVFWLAIVPAALSVSVLVLGVDEPARPAAATEPRWSRAALTALGRQYWGVVAIGGVFNLARFGEAFLLLRAQALGLPVPLVPLVLVTMNVVYALAAYPSGHWSDRVGRRALLILGFAVLILADLALASAASVAMVMLGVGLWGLHLGFTQGVLSAMVTDAAPARWRGTAFGIFNLANGVMLLAASLIAGWLWDAHGPPAPFLAGAAVTLLALALLAALYRPAREARASARRGRPRGRP